MEVVSMTARSGAGATGAPFQQRDVREWARLDRLTGALEHARLERDHWAAATATASLHYGKVVDERETSLADKQGRQRRQLEVYRATEAAPGGGVGLATLHVVRTSTSSSWSTRQRTGSSQTVQRSSPKDFDNLQLAINPLDLSSLKTKVSVGRSGSIGGRRPPSRPRSITKTDTNQPQIDSKTSRLCQPESNLKTLDITKEEDNVFEKYDIETNDKEFDKIITENGLSSKTSSPIEFEELVTNNKKDADTDRRLNTVLRGNNIDLNALDQILKSISVDTVRKFDSEKPNTQEKKKTTKRHSFITVESLKEVRGRLRKLSSSDDSKPETPKNEELDDGISSEDNMIKTDNFSNSNRVKSYVYGMENTMGPRKNIVGTGSLESRTSGRLSSSLNRSEDWYNRRKSYGFEQVHNQNNSISLQNKNKIESSTDSGICRSTEIFSVPTIKPQIFNKYNDSLKTENGSHIRKNANSTIVSLGVDLDRNKSEKKNDTNELFNIWNKMSLNNNKNEQTTITIPIISEEKTNDTNRKLFHRQLSEGSSVSIEHMNDSDLKRHSIAVDESKYVNKNKENVIQRRKSLILDDDNFEENNSRKKRVEFCKTEVHFAAESGRVNIVETDDKPPPTNNFRRRRRNSGLPPDQIDENNKNELPLTLFGDTNYEKQLFSLPDHDNIQINEIPDSYKDQPENILSNSNVTITSTPINNEIFLKDIIESDSYPRGILKNKMTKPIPYLLGDDNIPTKEETDHDNQESGKIWGVKLRPVLRESPPIWKSTVTVQNNIYNLSNKTDDKIGYVENVFKIEDNDTKKTFSNTFKNQNEDFKRSQNWKVSTQNSFRITDEKGEPKKAIEISSPSAFKVTNEEERSSNCFSDNSFKKEITPLKLHDEKNDFRRSPFKKDALPQRVASWRISTGNSLKSEGKERSSPIRAESFKIPLEDKLDFSKPTSFSTESAFKTPTEIKKSAWSVAERVKQVENFKWNENKGYSTKVNFGSSETTVVENEQDAFLWPEEQTIEIIEKPSLFSSVQADERYTNKTKAPIISVRTNSLAQNSEFSRSDRRQIIPAKTFDIQDDTLSSPMLVGNSLQNSATKELQKTKEEIIDNNKNKVSNSVNKILVSSYVRNLDSVEKKVIKKPPAHYQNNINIEKHSYGNIQKKDIPKNNKPDLIPTLEKKEFVNLSSVFNKKKISPKNTTNMSKSAEVKKISLEKRSQSPVYENIDDINIKNMSTDAILQELTKAADQILQAVNGYTDEDSKLSSDEHNSRRNSQVLETISESKTLKSQSTKKTQEVKSKYKQCKPTSSTSSLESISKDNKYPVRPNRSEKLREERTKKKVEGNNSEITKLTKARRLQRASSREALLQSHGSSSEDLPQIEVRKPRLVRRTKTQNSSSELSKKTATSYTYQRKKEPEVRKTNDRVPVVGLQEIRHKTAVSTIRSTAEKVASREKVTKGKEDVKKKIVTKSTFTRSTPQKLQSERINLRCSREAHHPINAVRTSSGVALKKSS